MNSFWPHQYSAILDKGISLLCYQKSTSSTSESTDAEGEMEKIQPLLRGNKPLIQFNTISKLDLREYLSSWVQSHPRYSSHYTLTSLCFILLNSQEFCLPRTVYPPVKLETTSSTVRQQYWLCKIISIVNRKRAVLPPSFLLNQDSPFYHCTRNWIWHFTGQKW